MSNQFNQNLGNFVFLFFSKKMFIVCNVCISALKNLSLLAQTDEAWCISRLQAQFVLNLII